MHDFQHDAVPSEVLYGQQTLLSLQHFAFPARQLSDVPEFLRNYALVKNAAARANLRLGVLDEERANAIVRACEEIADGQHRNQFPTRLVLGGGGTTTNMNMNEVIAARAAQIAARAVHPNDHVNASQSTNDTFPTAMALTIIDLARSPISSLHALADSLLTKAREYEQTRYLGRTCLQDAVSLRAGSTLGAQSKAVRRGAASLAATVGQLSAVPLGATVLGTCIGAPPEFTRECIAELNELVAIEVEAAPDAYDAMAHFDPYAAVADAAGRAAITVAKIAADIRLRASGPLGGLAEITIPSLQAGSSIMPGKVNPVVPELAMQLSYRVRGAVSTVSCAVAAGDLELNVMEPVILDSLIEIFEDVDRASSTMATLCIAGLKWDGARRDENLRHALDPWVERMTEAGYETATEDCRQSVPVN